jgi:SAM-dependent methyltransferase
MDRRQEILRHIAPGTRGIEVAPWHNPIVLPGGEHAAVALDLFDRPTLVVRAKADPAIDRGAIGKIGEVDLVGSACEIAELARARFGAEARFDFVLSSHNLEHLPDPVRFLRGCETVLAPGGVVAMAVPDKRACFDFFRPHSGTGELLEAWHERRERPSFAQIFGQTAYNAALRGRDGVTGAFTIDDNPGQIALLGDVAQAYATWRTLLEANDAGYHDTHCWTFTPSSLELILTELILLGIIALDIVAVTPPLGCEFFVHLRKRPAGAAAPDGLAGRRERLLQQTIDELAHSSRHAWGLRAAQRQAVHADAPPIQRGLLRRIGGRIGRCFGGAA